jgi:hypothetical protein
MSAILPRRSRAPWQHGAMLGSTATLQWPSQSRKKTSKKKQDGDKDAVGRQMERDHG